MTISYTRGGVTKTASQAITVKAKATVDEVKIDPSEISLEQGSSRTFGVAVLGTGDPSQEVTWSVQGNESDSTSIDENGKLTIGEDESAKTLTVKATSTVDSSKSASATVTVTAKAEEVSDDLQLVDEETGLEVSAVFGDGVDPEKVQLTVESIDEKDDSYETLVEPVSDMDILGVYDVSLSETAESIVLTFDVGEEYDGKDITVLHYKEVDDVTYMETYVVTAEKGKVTVELDSLSPIVLAVESAAGDSDTSEDDTSAGSDNAVDNGVSGGSESDSTGGSADGTSDTTAGSTDAAAQDDKSAATGDASLIGLWMMLATAAALGATVLIITRKKRIDS